MTENTYFKPAETEIYTLPVRIKIVSVDRSGRWLAAGWHDVWKSPAISLAYGGCFVLISFIFSFGLFEQGYGALVLPLVGAFVLIAPILVVGLYEIARRLETGEPVSFGIIWNVCWGHASQIAAMGVVMMIFCFVWILLAIVLFALFFNQGVPPLDQLAGEILFSLKGAVFLAIGTVLGAVLATGIFAISAVSIPMLLDIKIDVITAIAISFLAVRANWKVMMGWAAMIGMISFVALASFYVGLAIALPMLGYATWHAYRDLIEPI